MSWVKRNLYFVVSSVIAMALLVVALLYGLSKYKLNEDNRASLNEAYGKLSELINKDPNPGNETVDNIAAAAEQRKQILAVIDKARKHFAPIPSIPDLPHVTKSDFSAALPRTISELQHAAAAPLSPWDNRTTPFPLRNNAIKSPLPRAACRRWHASWAR